MKVKNEGDACKRHGGASLKGRHHPKYKDGRYSKYMPSGLLQKHSDFLSDPFNLSLEEEIKVSKALISENISQLGQHDMVALLKELTEIHRQMAIANRKSDGQALQALFTQMGASLTKGLGDAIENQDAENNLHRSLETTRRLTDTQRQIMVDKGELIPIGYVLMLIDTLWEDLEVYVIPLPGGKEAASKVGTRLFDHTGKLLPAKTG